jgi:hypothetical protein
MVSNLVRHGRPLHPFSTSQLSRPSRPKPSRASASQPPAPAAPAPTGPAVESDGSALPYPHFFRHGIRPIGFVVSATELDWWIRGIEPLYNIDSNAGDSPRRYESFRSGGWWGLYVVGQLALLGVEIRRRRRLGWGPGERRMVALLGVATVAICLTPNSYLLRYWLFWPLLLVTATTRLAVARRGERSRLVLAGALGATFLVSYFALPTQADFAPRPVHRYDAATLRARLHPELRRAIEAGERFCLDGDHFPGTFRYSAAVLGGRHVIEQIRGGRPCTVYPRLDVPARWRPPGAAVR